MANCSARDAIAIMSIASANTKLRFQLSLYRRRRAASFTIPAYKQMKMTIGGTSETSVRMISPNENKMSDGGRDRASLGVGVWRSSQKWRVRRSDVRSIAWLGLTCSIRVEAILYAKCTSLRNVFRAPRFTSVLSTDGIKGYILPLPILFPSPYGRLLVFVWRRIASELSRNIPFEYVLPCVPIMSCRVKAARAVRDILGVAPAPS